MNEIEPLNIEPLTVGATLKRRREELGLTLSGLAEKTCIRSTFLQAMEDDRFDGFPGDAYLHGFLKLFAEALRLDTSAVIDQFRAQTGIPAGGRAMDSAGYALPAVAPRRKGKLLAMILRIVVLCGLTFVAVNFGLHYWSLSKDPSLTDPPQLSAVSGEFSLPASSVAPLIVVAADAEKSLPESPPVLSDLVVPAEPQGSAYIIPFGGELLRVEALGSVHVEALIDDHPLKLYALAKGTVLSWRVLKSLQLQVDAPDLLNVWLGNEPFELQGRTQLTLQVATSAAKEGADQ